jgi:hypothetical protein
MVDNAATIDWLMDLGFKPAPGTPVAGEAHEAYATRRYLWGTNKAVSILDTLKPVHDRLVQQRKIDLRLQHRMSALLTDSRGAVIGVRGLRPAEVEFHAKSVVCLRRLRVQSAALARADAGDTAVFAGQPLFARRWRGGRARARRSGGWRRESSAFAGVLSATEGSTSGAALALSLRSPDLGDLREPADKRLMPEDHQSIDYRERSLLAQKNMEMSSCSTRASAERGLDDPR